MRLILGFAMFGLATAASAQTAPPRPMLSEACRTEVQTLCPVSPDGDRRARAQCMMSSEAKLTDGCKKEVADLRAAREKWRAENGGGMSPSNGDGPPPPQ